MTTHSSKRTAALPFIVALLVLTALTLHAQTTAFTYQGHLMDGGASANGNYDIQFRLLDADTAGSDLGTPQVVAPVNVVNGIFTVALNFGLGPFSGSDRWLEMSVRPFGSVAARTVLAPRQKLTSAPYAVRSFISTNAQSLIGPIGGSNIPAGTITSSMIAPGAITSSRIAPGTVNPWVSITNSGPSTHVAAANTVYHADNNDLATFTLPTSANLGEIIQIMGTGSGGWTTGAAWVPRESNRVWTSIACSADGQRLVAAEPGWLIFTSMDGGANWAPGGAPLRDWESVASSADGTKLVAGAFNAQIYTSTDSGANWTPRESSRVWRSVASSADGSKLVAVADGGQIYTSTDSGVNWTPRDSNRSWRSVASSADGSRLVAVVNGGQIYTSTDSGANWAPRESNRNWWTVASSTDGSKLVASVDGGRIYTSTDSGVNWAPKESNRNWRSVASSADGSRLVAVVQSGQIYTSTNSGANWLPQESNRNWWAVASSADGSKLAATVINGQIYTSGGNYAGGQGDSLALQYVGQGIWTQMVDASESSKVNRGGDTMTGQLNLPANGLRVGGSQLITSGGLTALGTATPEPGFTMTLGGTPTLGTLDGLLMLRDRNGVNQWNLLQNSTDGGLFLIKLGGGGFTHAFQADGNVGIKTDAPTATLDVNGATRMRDVTRQGSETGTSETPGFGVLTRRVNSTSLAAGQIVARTPNMTLERDGSSGGWVVKFNGTASYTIAAMGINSAGAAVNHYSSGSSAGPITVYTNAQDVVFFRLQFGDPFHSLNQTEVTLSRHIGDHYWNGTMTSTHNQ